MKKRNKTTQVARENLFKEIQSDKEFVENLMKRIARVRWELKHHFEKSKTTDVSEILDDEVSSCDNWLVESYYGLNGIHATLIEMEVCHG